MPNAPDRIGWLWPPWAILLLLIGLAFATLISGLPGRDSSVFIHVADGLLQGELPYVDRWDHKGPLIYVVDAVGRLATPDSLLGLRIVEIAAMTLGLTFAFGALRRAFGAQAALFGIAVVTAAAIAHAEVGNFTEEWALLPALAALYLFVRVHGRQLSAGRTRAMLVTIGIAGALAFLLRPNLVGVWLAIGVFWLLLDSDRARNLTWAGLGGIGTLTVAAALSAAAGILPDLIDAVFVYNSAYSSSSSGSDLFTRAQATWSGLPAAGLLVAGWVVSITVALRPRGLPPGGRALVQLAALLAPIEFVLLSVSGRAYPHYYLALVPVAMILAALAGWLLVRGARKVATRSSDSEDPRAASRATAMFLDAVPLTVAWILCGALLVGRFGDWVEPAVTRLAHLDGTTAGGNSRWDQAARYIESVTAPEDSVLVWGSEPSVHLLSGRDAPTRYFYQYPLVTTGYATEDNAAEFTADILADPPAVIIDTINRNLPRLDPGRRARWQPAAEAYATIPQGLDAFFAFVDSSYVRDPDIAKWEAYRLRSSDEEELIRGD